MVIAKPLACKSFAKEAAIMPFPKEEVTPPVTKMYFVIINLIVMLRDAKVEENNEELRIKN